MTGRGTSRAAILATLVLAGCASAPEPIAPEADPFADNPTATACLSEEQKALVGQSAAVAEAQLPAAARILAPDTVYEQNYLPNRVNADLDRRGTVVRMWCG